MRRKRLDSKELYPARNGAVRRPVITTEEDDIINKRMHWSSGRGFA